jgi:hypothetical protein
VQADGEDVGYHRTIGRHWYRERPVARRLRERFHDGRVHHGHDVSPGSGPQRFAAVRLDRN